MKKLFASTFDKSQELMCLELLIEDDGSIYTRETVATYKTGCRQAWKKTWAFTALHKRDIIGKMTRADRVGEPLEIMFRGHMLHRVKCTNNIGPRKVKV